MHALAVFAAVALSPSSRTSIRSSAIATATSMDRLNVAARGRESVVDPEIPKLFWPMLEHLANIMPQELSGFTDLEMPHDLHFVESAKPRSTMESWCFKSDRLRKVRCTYIDAGAQAQVLNSLWYPSPELDLPVLGLDLLSFGPKKLCVIDIQPLPYAREYHHELVRPLDAVRKRYPLFLGEKSNKIYSDDIFFSPIMLFGRFKDAEEVKNTLFPVFKEYVAFYIKMLNECEPNTDPAKMEQVLGGQRDYDQYNSERDPAIGLFKSYYGADFANSYVYDFLFTSAEPTHLV